MKIITYVISFVFAIAIISCVDVQRTYRKPVLLEFPLRPGSSWIYKHYDATTKILDTVSVYIDSEEPLEDGSYKYDWVFKSKTGAVTYPVYLTGTTIKSLPKPFGAFGIVTQLTFPLKTMRPQHPQVMVPAGVFPKCFLIKRSPHIGNTRGLFQYWISPGIGIVKISKKMFDTIRFEQIDESWELISYTV